MLLLSCLNQDYRCDQPVDILYLNYTDRSLILKQADRIGKFVTEYLGSMESPSGKEIVDTVQYINGDTVNIKPETAALLTRLRECYKVFKRSKNIAAAEEDTDDLGTDAIILRLEGNPKFVYVYVYNLMENKGLEYNVKMAKLLEIYNSIINHVQVQNETDREQASYKRLELQSTAEFWQRMLTLDVMRDYQTTRAITPKDLENVKKELRMLGLYGFVDPLKMFKDFSGSRVNRKVNVQIGDEVIEFLERVVKSGGALN